MMIERQEIFKPITDLSVPGIDPNCYYISSFGNVYSKKSNRYLTKVQTWNGYWRVYLYLRNGYGRYHLIHRILLTEFFPIPGYNNLQVNHINGNKNDNYLWNLEWCTASQNIIHAYNTGLKSCKHGEDCSFCTISNETAYKIAEMLSEQKYTHKEISKILNVPEHIISNISCGTTWKWLYDKFELEKYKKPAKPKMSDENLILLCKYLKANRYKYKTNSDLFRAALKDLFGIN